MEETGGWAEKGDGGLDGNRVGGQRRGDGGLENLRGVGGLDGNRVGGKRMSRGDGGEKEGRRRED